MSVWGVSSKRSRANLKRAKSSSKGPIYSQRARSAMVARGMRSVSKYYNWPDIGQVVNMAMSQESLPLPVKILDHDTSGDFILVSAPGGKGKGALVVESGDKIILTWVLPNGIARLETVFISLSDDVKKSPTIWRLEPIAEVEVTERRHFYRAKARQNVYLAVEAGSIPGVLVDISERGMRCLVDTITPGKLTREHLQTRVNLSGKPVNLKGLVAWSKHHGGHVEVGVTFAKLRKQDNEIIKSHISNCLAKIA